MQNSKGKSLKVVTNLKSLKKILKNECCLSK